MNIFVSSNNVPVVEQKKCYQQNSHHMQSLPQGRNTLSWKLESRKTKNEQKVQLSYL